MKVAYLEFVNINEYSVIPFVNNIKHQLNTFNRVFCNLIPLKGVVILSGLSEYDFMSINEETR